ncbi:hypothetical protein U1Q18_011359 [Sarracenia purpurea var. burkii]
MDSTSNPTFNPQPSHYLPIKPSASKLPIKRKIPHSSSIPNPTPTPTPTPILSPKLESTTDYGEGSDQDDVVGGGDRSHPPFKFHRIWTEPDEIRFLQGLLDCSTAGLSFPRDLNVFYASFSGTMSQPYTKSQLSEKLRRLRKKFRVISSRITRGLDEALLSPHDRALFELSKQLWHPEFSSASPFGAGNKQKKSDLVGVKVSFSPTPSPALNDHGVLNDTDDKQCKNFNDRVVDGGFDVDADVKLRDVNVEFDDGVRKKELSMPISSDGDVGCDYGHRLGQVVVKTVIDVFDQSSKEVSEELLDSDQGSDQASSSKDEKVDDFERRWREQRVAELDVLARRLIGSQNFWDYCVLKDPFKAVSIPEASSVLRGLLPGKGE